MHRPSKIGLILSLYSSEVACDTLCASAEGRAILTATPEARQTSASHFNPCCIGKAPVQIYNPRWFRDKQHTVGRSSAGAWHYDVVLGLLASGLTTASRGSEAVLEMAVAAG